MKLNSGMILISSILLTACGGGGSSSGGGSDPKPAKQQSESTTTALPKFLSSTPIGCQFTVNGDQFELNTFAKALSEVSALHCNGVTFADLEGIDQLTGLKVLSLVNAGLTQVDELSAIQGITELDLSNNELLSLNEIAQLTGLLTLSVSENNLTDIKMLATLSNLESLDLSSNALTNIDNLASLGSLIELDLSDNQLADSISLLSSLTSLVKLQLTNNADIDCTDVIDLEDALAGAGAAVVVLPPEQCSSKIMLEIGTDEFFDNALEAPPYDRVVISNGYVVTDLKLAQQGDNLRIELPNAEGNITFENWFKNNASTVGIFEIPNEDELTFDELRDKLPLHNILTIEDDIFSGTDKVDIVNGSEGDDSLQGGDGDDQLSGGAGEDEVIGGKGSDILHGGPGDGDKMIGASDPSTDSEPYIDTYLFNIGDGADSLIDNVSSEHHGNLIFGPSIIEDNIIVSREGNDVTLTVDSTNKITIKNWFYSTQYQIATITFDGEPAQSAIDFVLANLMGFGTNGDDTFNGSYTTDNYDGLAGNDIINGNYGNDTLFGGDGTDILNGGDGEDTLNGGPGDGDILNGSYGIDTYIFNLDDGLDSINDSESSSENNGILVFGPGIYKEDITLAISDSNLVISINNNDKVTINNWFHENPVGKRIKSIQFSGFEPQSANDFVLARETFGSDGDDTINGTKVEDKLNGGNGNDTIRGDNDDDTLSGGNGTDTIYGENGNDTLHGGSGNSDVLEGGDGDDTLNGGPGDNDLLTGGGWEDTYVFNMGDGKDSLNDHHASYGGNIQGNLVFGSGINKSNVTLTFADEDLTFVVNDNDNITVKHWFKSPLYRIATIQFSDTAPLDALDFFKLQPVFGSNESDVFLGSELDENIYGNGGNDSLQGNYGNDMLFGGEGTDSIDGGEGDDTLNGGPGDNDHSVGGDGKDLYIFNIGDGEDSIYNYNYLGSNDDDDIIVFGPGITKGNITLTFSGDDLTFVVNDNDKITVKHWFEKSQYRITKVQLSNASPLDALSFVTSQPAFGSNENDTFSGSIENDYINGSNGDDTLHGKEGDDSLYGGEGTDFIDGDSGEDTLNGGPGNGDHLIGGDGKDSYIFNIGDGEDSIYNYNYLGSNDDDDTLFFGAGIDENDVTLEFSGDDLTFVVNDSDKVTISNWFKGSKYQLTTLQFGNTQQSATDFVTEHTPDSTDEGTEQGDNL